MGVPAIIISASTLVNTFYEVEKLTGRSVAVLLYRSGRRAGRQISGFLRKKIGADNLEGIRDFYRAIGWGTPELHSRHVVWHDSFIARAWKARGYPPGKVCHFLRGYVHGFYEGLYGIDVIQVEEEKCLAAGDPYCLFRIIERGSGYTNIR